MSNTTPKWLIHEIEQLNQACIKILHQLKFNDVVNRHFAFIRSGEITNAGELVYHLLDEVVSEKDKLLFDALRLKLRSPVPPEKLFQAIAMRDYGFREEFDKTLNRFTLDFVEEYCLDGRINWGKLAEL